MKKLFAVLALVGVMTSCKDKKKDEKKPEETTTTTDATTTPTDATTTTNTTATPGVPTFSDPEVQKFANDYGAFMAEYKAGMNDPAKLAELSKSMQDWAAKSQTFAVKLASNPDEAKKWSDWAMELSKSLMPETK